MRSPLAVSTTLPPGANTPTPASPKFEYDVIWSKFMPSTGPSGAHAHDVMQACGGIEAIGEAAGRRGSGIGVHAFVTSRCGEHGPALHGDELPADRDPQTRGSCPRCGQVPAKAHVDDIGAIVGGVQDPGQQR